MSEKVVTERVDRWSYDEGDERVVVAELVTRVGDPGKPEHVKVNGVWYQVKALVALGRWLGTVAVLALALGAPARADWSDDAMVTPLRPDGVSLHSASYLVSEDERTRGTFSIVFDCSSLNCATNPRLRVPVAMARDGGEAGAGGLSRMGFTNALGAQWDGWVSAFTFPLPPVSAPILFTVTFEDGSTAEYVLTRKGAEKLLKQARDMEKFWAQRAKDNERRAAELLK